MAELYRQESRPWLRSSRILKAAWRETGRLKQAEETDPVSSENT
jgi:hypothetical protein